jgi:hypothetical protein
MFFLVFQRIFIEAIFDAVYFPVWWYTGGAKHALIWCFGVFISGNAALAPGLWLKNIFVPMFGQYDIHGRIISFFMRLFQVIGRGIALVVWLAVCLALFAAWLVLPAVVVFDLVIPLIS